jgi:hypothetical protein
MSLELMADATAPYTHILKVKIEINQIKKSLEILI